MARTVNPTDHAQKRNEILDAAQRLVYIKGYERMTIGDILADVQISSGAFYHYFPSKPAVLEAFVERAQQTMERELADLLSDPHMPALEKLQHFFMTLDRLRIAHKRDIVELLRVWYNDENAIVRQKVDAALMKRRTPLLTEIIRQGIQEGVFANPYPDQAGEIILALLQGMSTAHATLLLSLGQEYDELRCIERIVSTHAAYMEAIERVLCAPTNSLYRVNTEAVQRWVVALRMQQ